MSVLLAACASFALAQPAPVAADQPPDAPAMIVGASSDEHVWFVVESKQNEQGFELFHHSVRARGPYVRTQAPLARRPIAMAAWDNQVWLVFSPAGDDGSLSDEVFTLHAVRDAHDDFFAPEPPDRLEALPALPAGFSTIDAAAGAGRPKLLMRGDSGDAKLLELESGAWREKPLPEGFTPTIDARIVAWGAEGEGLVLATTQPDAAGQAAFHQCSVDSDWRRFEIDRAPERVLRLIRSANQVVAVAPAPSGRVELMIVRPRLLSSITVLNRPKASWGIFGVRDGFRVIEQARQGDLTLRRIDLIAGRSGEAVAVTSPPLDPVVIFREPAILAAAAIAIGLLFLFRRGESSVTQLPAAMEIAPGSIRAAAFLIDLVPGALASMIVFRCGLLDLLAVPFLSLRSESWPPYLVLIAVTAGHSLLGELLVQRSLGKALVGLRITDVHGARPGVPSVILRNAVKGITLFLPLFLLIVALTPNQQGLHDMTGRTIVVRKRGARGKGR